MKMRDCLCVLLVTLACRTPTRVEGNVEADAQSTAAILSEAQPSRPSVVWSVMEQADRYRFGAIAGGALSWEAGFHRQGWDTDFTALTSDAIIGRARRDSGAAPRRMTCENGDDSGYSRDGRYLACACTIFDTSAKKRLPVALKTHVAAAKPASWPWMGCERSWSPDSRHVLLHAEQLGMGEQLTNVYDVVEKRVIWVCGLEDECQRFIGVGWSGNGRRFVTQQTGKVIYVWDSDSRGLMAPIALPEPARLASVFLDYDGAHVASAGESGALYIGPVEGGAVAAAEVGLYRGASFAWRPGESVIAAVSKARELVTIDADGKVHERWGVARSPNRVSWAADGSAIAVETADGIQVVRLGSASIVTFMAVRGARGLVPLAVDSEGYAEGSPEALAGLRYSIDGHPEPLGIREAERVLGRVLERKDVVSEVLPAIAP